MSSVRISATRVGGLVFGVFAFATSFSLVRRIQRNAEAARDVHKNPGFDRNRQETGRIRIPPLASSSVVLELERSCGEDSRKISNAHPRQDQLHLFRAERNRAIYFRY